jgi:hypothetical protein
LQYIGFDKSSFFSDNVLRFGNIGHPMDSDLDKYMGYLSSPESTIREKVAGITNSIVNGTDRYKKNKLNTLHLYNYIMSHEKPNPWLNKRREQIKELMKGSILHPSDYTHHWAPLYFLYPGYRIKYDITHSPGVILNHHIISDEDKIKQSDLSEPLSRYEISFLQNHMVDPDPDKSLPMVYGKTIYKDVYHLLPEYEYRDDSIVIGGISGHTMLLLELALLVDINWKPILFACIISQVPHHHSIAEIVDALQELDIDKIDSSDSYLDIIIKIAKTLDIELK